MIVIINGSLLDPDIWRATRHRRRANELTWISAEHKAQILRALRPEMSGEAIA